MATVSGTALPNSSFPILTIGAGASSRPPSIRNINGAAGVDGNANQNSGATGSALAARDSGIDGQNGVRLAGDNGALLDLNTSLAAQTAGDEDGDSGNPNDLTEAEEEQVAELKRADAEVRRHEAAHAAAGGAYAGSPSYTYTRGPDGQLYATGGEVSIDTAPVDGDPAATIQKLQTVRRAALAPGEPSSQDRAVAAQAEAGIRRAQAELQAERSEELTGESEGETGETNQIGAPAEPGNPVTGAEGVSTPGNGFFGGEQDRGNAGGDASARIASLIDIAV